MDPFSKEQRKTYLRLAMVKSDTPQRNQNTRHLAVGANEKCNKCPCPTVLSLFSFFLSFFLFIVKTTQYQENVWDENYDIKTLKYRIGIHEVISSYKIEIGASAFEVLSFFISFSQR